MEGPQAAADRAHLSTLGPKDKYLALTKPHYDNIRASCPWSALSPANNDRAHHNPASFIDMRTTVVRAATHG
jgi:hypothetical protein